MARRIQVDFRKWPDRVHRQLEMEYLDEDTHGLWVWRAPGWPMQRGDDPPIAARHTAVKLITRNEWWTAMWSDESPPAVYVDIATPPRWQDDRVTMIDLDLDVVRRGDGPVEIHDEDEFDEHRTVLGYPSHVVDRALSTTEEIVAAVESGREPFGRDAHSRLEQALAMQGPAGG